MELLIVSAQRILLLGAWELLDRDEGYVLIISQYHYVLLLNFENVLREYPFNHIVVLSQLEA